MAKWEGSVSKLLPIAWTMEGHYLIRKEAFMPYEGSDFLVLGCGKKGRG
jgi:hypothetical protein